MRLPSKVTKVEDSIFPVLLLVLKELNNGKINVLELLIKIKGIDTGDFLEAIDTLYFLGVLDYEYVEGTNMYVKRT